MLLVYTLLLLTATLKGCHGFEIVEPEHNFAIEPNNITVNLGESVIFHCAVDNKIGVVKWVKVDESDILSEDSTIDDDNDVTRLTIESPRPNVDFNLKINTVTEEDAGIYACVVTMGTGDSVEFEFSRHAYLDVIVQTTNIPTTETTPILCVKDTTEHACADEPLSDDYKISTFDITFQNIDWTDDLLEPTSCRFNNEAVTVIDILFNSFDASQLKDKIKCLTIISFTRRHLVSGEYAVQINVEIPVPINAGISKEDLDNAFTCGLLRTNTSSLPDHYAQMEDYFCNYEDPTTTPLPIVTEPNVQTTRTTKPPTFLVTCTSITDHRMCSRHSVKQTVVNLVLLVEGIEWKNELRDQRSCYYQNVGANITKAMFAVFDIQPIQESNRCFYIQRYDQVSSERSSKSEDVFQASLEFGISRSVGNDLTESYMEELVRTQLVNSTDVYADYRMRVSVIDVQVSKEEPESGPTQPPATQKTDKTMIIVYLVLGGLALLAVGITTVRLIIHRITRVPPELRQKLYEKRLQRNAAKSSEEGNGDTEKPQDRQKGREGKYEAPDDGKVLSPTDIAQNGFIVHPRHHSLPDSGFVASTMPPWQREINGITRQVHSYERDIGQIDGLTMNHDRPLYDGSGNDQHSKPRRSHDGQQHPSNSIAMVPWSQYSSRTDTHY